MDHSSQSSKNTNFIQHPSPYTTTPTDECNINCCRNNVLCDTACTQTMSKTLCGAYVEQVRKCTTFAYMGHVFHNCVTIFTPCNFPQLPRKLTYLAVEDTSLSLGNFNQTPNNNVLWKEHNSYDHCTHKAIMQVQQWHRMLNVVPIICFRVLLWQNNLR